VTAIVELAPGAWDGLIERLGCADAYLRSEYVASATCLDDGRPVFLHLAATGGDVVFAAIVRDVPGSPRRDVTTPYGYGGPVAVGADPPTARFHELYDEWCVANGIVSTFVRFHPLFANHRYAAPSVHVAALGRTVGWQLRAGDLFAAMHRSHRNKCRKAQRAGVTVETTVAPAELSSFARLYRETMRRQQASDFYFFADEYWRALGRFRDRLVRADAFLDGEIVASALCLATQPWLHYHLSATQDAARDLGASNLLLYETAVWARSEGFDAFHLGGGVGGREDSLFSFKRCFSPDDLLDCRIGKAVHDRDAYLGLAKAAEIDFDGFFPAYRHPAATASSRPVSASEKTKTSVEQTCQVTEANGRA
jgi:hypothetical protein